MSRLGDAVADKDGAIGAHDAATHLHRTPAAASTTPYYPSSPARAGSASAWQPLLRSVPQRRRVGTTSTPAPAWQNTARMTWPPARTPMRGLAGGSGSDALSSLKPRGGLTREEEDHLGLLGSLRSRPQPRALPPGRDAGAKANASTPALTALLPRVPPPRRTAGINASASASSTTSSSASPPSTHQSQLQASAASTLCSTAPPVSALATTPRGTPPTKPPTATPGARRQPPTTQASTGTPGALPRRSGPKTKSPTATGTPTAHLPLQQTTKPITDAPSPRINQAPPPPFVAAFGQRFFEVLFNMNYGHRGTPTMLPTSRLSLTSEVPPSTHMAAFGQTIIEVLFNLNYGHLGYSGVVLMGVYAGLEEMLSGWNPTLKAFYVLLLILCAFALGAGLMAATSVSPTAYTHRVSSVCSRLCTCLATFVFIVALACHLGSHGYIAGIVLGLAAVAYMLAVWVEGDPAAHDAYTVVQTGIKDLWQRFRRCGRRGPLLP